MSHPQARRPPAVPPTPRSGTARKRKGLCRMRALGPGCPRGSVIQGFGGRICNKDMQSDAIYNQENWKQPKSPPTLARRLAAMRGRGWRRQHVMREGELRGDRASCVGGAKYNAVCTQRVITGHCGPVSEARPSPACTGPTPPHSEGLGQWSPQQPAGGRPARCRVLPGPGPAATQEAGCAGHL